MHLSTTAMALIEHLHLLESPLIGQAHRQIGMLSVLQITLRK
jgi:hypothetical protein